MATTSSQASPVPFNTAPNGPPQRSGSGLGRPASARSKRLSIGSAEELAAAQNYGMIPPMAPAAPEPPRGPPVSFRNSPMLERADMPYRGAVPRSFSVRSRNQTPESVHALETIGYEDGNGAPYEQLQYPPSGRRVSAGHPTYATPPPAMANSPSQASPMNRVRNSRGPSEALSRPTSESQASPVSRSSTVRSTTSDKFSAPTGRSPLQQLEGRLVGMSKEEKRARVIEAEKRLREKMANRESQRGSLAVPDAPVNTKADTAENQQNFSQPDVSRDTPEFQPQKRQASVSRKPVVPEHAQYATVQTTQEPQYALSQDSQRMHGPPSQPQQRHQSGRQRIPPVNGQSVPPAQYRNRQVSPGVYDPSPIAPGIQRTGSIKTQRQIRPNYDTQRPVTSAGGQPIPAAQDARPVTSYNEQTFLDPDTEVRPTHFAGEALNQAVGGQQQTPEDARDVSPALKKSKRNTVSFDVPPPTPPPLDEWRKAPVAILRLIDRDFERLDVDKGKAWWEKGSSKRRQSRALPNNYRKPTPKVNERNRFNPLLFLKCGPLLRYLGIRKATVDGPQGPTEQEVWRGSVMIVTTDSMSSLETPPTLRLFAQPMDLLPPPPQQINDEEGAQLAPEYVDPVAGLVKLGRDGRALYVKPVDHLEEGVDLSSVESEDGLFESSRSPIDYGTDQNKGSTSIPSNRLHPVNGENSGLYEEVQGFRLYSDPARDVTFWRFNIEVELGDKQERIAYRINEGPAIGFWVPAKGQSMNIMFHSCNGFSLSVDRNKFSGPDPLWRDVLNEHQTRPFHVMLGGGDQLYCDKVMQDSEQFEEWTRIKNPHHKNNAPLSPAFKAELESFYLNHYAACFSRGLFSLANCQIPMVNIWDDHDIIDGFGSYPDHLMRSPVFSGLGNVAFKYYMLFQHQSLPEETEADEPSWLLGADVGPYIKERSRSLFMSLGKGVSFLGIDCRTERMREEVVSEHTYDLIWDRCYREIERGQVKHLIVLLGVPIAYPRLVWLENILSSRAMDPVKALTRAGLFSGFVNKFDGGVEILDDVDDHWTAKHHKTERTLLIEDLQDLAAEKSVRITILGGDVHLAAIGQFYSNPTLGIPKDKDYRYMPNVISSAIVNAPPPEMLADFLNKRNKVHHMDSNTDEDMIPIFTHDVDGKNRNNKRLLPRRNWCSIREYHPGTTPPPTPPTPVETPDIEPENARPGLLKRTLSLGRGESQPHPSTGLLRRRSGRGAPPTKDFNLDNAQQRRFSTDATATRRPPENGDSYFAASDEPRPGPFHRRTTDLSAKASKKAAPTADGETFVNLEGGLDITLNCEVNPQDPAGITTPYKLLVPALWFEGNGFDPEPQPIRKGWRKWLGRGKPKRGHPQQHDDHQQEVHGHADSAQQARDVNAGSYDDDDDDDDEDEEEYRQGHGAPQTHPYAQGAAQYDDEAYSDEELDTPPKRKKWLGLV
ncbi:hypothetical protein TMatcc_000103 [Talaromyces marneffei ATCC 18224]|uniref:PhoD-like phosphatase domain-containing protein n=1 Tax=Talaromyces marneffei (strain ATCC 18224 / CBS 334.59 / QM 7333) TaxID=441960 RepID=B6QQ07_TALMQ|nr:uncharacterized protein EYB26_005192 [Talaromyces marneffei]EEA20129.1 conserved hypothetical protein [Talaromyces marneffei ATCC 18224]QGA17521.1 hypothetical protein EYB26_005192 [Talaromyces marneffei]